MLGRTVGARSLIFPTLLAVTTDQDGDILHQLSWEKKELAHHETKFSPHDDQYLTALPQPYDDWIKSIQYSLTSEYIREIEHMSNAGKMEWGRTRRFDTMVREFCLEPAIAHIWTAFRLLADCAWDEPNRWWYRDKNLDHVIIPYALAYKFWRNQTGIGMTKSHARIPDLSQRLEHMLDNDTIIDHQPVTEIRKFFAALAAHEDLIHKQHSERYPGVPASPSTDVVPENSEPQNG